MSNRDEFGTAASSAPRMCGIQEGWKCDPRDPLDSVEGTSDGPSRCVKTGVASYIGFGRCRLNVDYLRELVDLLSLWATTYKNGPPRVVVQQFASPDQVEAASIEAADALATMPKFPASTVYQEVWNLTRDERWNRYQFFGFPNPARDSLNEIESMLGICLFVRFAYPKWKANQSYGLGTVLPRATTVTELVGLKQPMVGVSYTEAKDLVRLWVDIVRAAVREPSRLPARLARFFDLLDGRKGLEDHTYGNRASRIEKRWQKKRDENKQSVRAASYRGVRDLLKREFRSSSRRRRRAHADDEEEEEDREEVHSDPGASDSSDSDDGRRSRRRLPRYQQAVPSTIELAASSAAVAAPARAPAPPSESFWQRLMGGS
jgi:hypothetical protein